MKKTKVIVRKQKQKQPKAKQPRQKQKQRQSVNVNVHIDQSKRTTPRKPKSDTPSKPINFPPPVAYQPPNPPSPPSDPPTPPPPPPQIYGLLPVSNTSDSLSSVISKEQNAQRFESLMEQKSIQPSISNLQSVSTQTDPLGEAINIQQRKNEFAFPSQEQVVIENNDNDEEESNDIPLEENKKGGGGGAVELTRQEKLSQNYFERKEARKTYTPTELKKMNLEELQQLAKFLNIGLENPKSGKGSGRGSKPTKTSKQLIEEIKDVQDNKPKQGIPEEEPVYVYSGKSRKK